jgi:PAS domain S-box-containing protein
MAKKPTYEQLEQRVKELEQAAFERRRADEALPAIEEQWHSLVDNAPCIIIIVDCDGIIQYINHAVTGLEPEKVVGTSHYDYAPPEYHKVMKESIEHVFETGQAANYEIAGVGPDGRTSWYMTRLGPIKRNGQFIAVTIMPTDITERKLAQEALKEAHDKLERRVEERTAELVKTNEQLRQEIEERKRVEEALRESEERLRLALSAADMGTWRWDPVTNQDTRDASFNRMLGHEAEEFAQSVEDFIEHVHPEDRSAVHQEIQRAIRELDTYFAEFRIIRPDRTVRWLRDRGKVYSDEHGKVSYMTGVVVEITEQKRAEEERKELEAKLLQAHKLEAIGTLAGGIAHDFNNALMPIIVNTQMALMDVPERSSVRPLLEAVLKAGDHAKNLVRQILAFSRQAEQDQQPVQMSPLIKETLKLLRSTLPSTIKIDEQFQAASDTVIADPTQVHQIVLNLCTNAAHAMLEKGGVLSVSLTDIDVDSGAAADHPDLLAGKYVRLTVNDTGHGMDHAVMERIFEPFFTTKGSGEGTGMGLSTVHGIVKSHGGAITVDSEPQKRSTFHVYLPVSDIDVTDEMPTTEPLLMGTEHILLVDDEEWILTTIQLMLERLGYNVTALTSSLEAMEAFRSQPDKFDLVITDITMPYMTGEVLARQLSAIRPDISIILCTGYSERVSKEKSKEIGIEAYLMKPIKVHEMAKTIRKVLDKD